MLLVSEMAAADWGDVYYCQMTALVKITPDGEITKHTLEKFQFKLDQTKNAMVFGSTGSFANEVSELTTGSSFPSQEFWHANGVYSMTNFRKGEFLHSIVLSNAMFSISAKCDKF